MEYANDCDNGPVQRCTRCVAKPAFVATIRAKNKLKQARTKSRVPVYSSVPPNLLVDREYSPGYTILV